MKGLTQLENDKQPQQVKPPSVSNKRPIEHYQPPPPVKATQPPIQPTMEKTAYDHTMPRAESYQPRRDIQDCAPLFKTESPVVFDCEKVPEESHEMVAADEYQADYTDDES